jgi:hypothetical protein
MRTLLGFAISIWNSTVTEELGISAVAIAEVRAELTDRAPAEILAWFDRLTVRKRERFCGELHAKLAAAQLLP